LPHKSTSTTHQNFETPDKPAGEWKEVRRGVRKKEAHLVLDMRRPRPGKKYLQDMEKQYEKRRRSSQAGNSERERTRERRDDTGSPVE
jgi:hypothetical protein